MSEDTGERKPETQDALPRGVGASVYVVTAQGLSQVAADACDAKAVGAKAAGLLSLPSAWVPRFFVIQAAVAINSVADQGAALQELCINAIRVAGISSSVIIRSSGESETMQERGRLVSQPCKADDVASVLHSLVTRTGDAAPQVHWIVQSLVSPARKGHLSNERRLAYEHRDWLMEVESQNGLPGFVSRVAVRSWRDGTVVDEGPLQCSSEAQIGLVLKNVAMRALGAGKRMHFEWVWSGGHVWVVQGDVADPVEGIDPRKTTQGRVQRVRPSSLRVFRVANSEDLDRYGKLKNAKLYGELGYRMPTFYVLDQRETLTAALKGTIGSDLSHDLVELTKRPLIVRTDGTTIPAAQREMLPRSDELRRADEAQQWIIAGLAPKLASSGIDPDGVCLIAHHFVPSAASAWVRAEPLKRMVRIESLWGVPEGLYWYSHDTFEVDVETGQFFKRLRYKGTFVGADAEGRWVPLKTKEPLDWRRSIRSTAWIREMATTTRAIADREQMPVSVMWLVDAEKRVTPHRVMPWFHSRSDLSAQPKAAPRRKITASRDQLIAKREDWERVKQMVAVGLPVERVVITPSDPELIREPAFVEDVATLTAKHQIVVEMAGGVLSHAYYVLTRHGAQVECVDLFGAEPEVREFNKLVRDKVPGSIQLRGEDVEVVKLKGDAYMGALKQKLVEEAYEALDARGGNEVLAELADVREVVDAVCVALGIPKREVEGIQEEKRKDKGGFEHGVMLRRTSTPHSLSAPRREVLQAMTGEGEGSDDPATVLRVSDIPAGPAYRRPDLRTIGAAAEKLFTFETALARTTEVPSRQTTRFALPLDMEGTREFTMVVEFSRHQGVLRGTVRLRVEPEQMRLGGQLSLDLGTEPEGSG